MFGWCGICGIRHCAEALRKVCHKRLRRPARAYPAPTQQPPRYTATGMGAVDATGRGVAGTKLVTTSHRSAYNAGNAT